MKLSRIFSLLCTTAIMALVTVPAQAEMRQITVAKQYGVSYLPLMIMEDQKLIEKHAAKRGHENLNVRWVTFAGGNVMNEAIISGNLQYASGGVAPLVRIWAATHGRNVQVKAVSAINAMPLYLNTRNPNVQSIRDFTERDKIALPAVGVSIQAVTLQMAAAQEFGENNYQQLDRFTVSMSHPDGMAAMMHGQSEINSHFSAPPFQYQQLQNQDIRTVVNSYDVLGGPATFNLVWTTNRFRDQNPTIYAAFLDALHEAIELIKADKRKAAEDYVRIAGSGEVDFIYGIITDDLVEYTTVPLNTTKYSDFLHKVGGIRVKPESWKDMFFEEIHEVDGS